MKCGWFGGYVRSKNMILENMTGRLSVPNVPFYSVKRTRENAGQKEKQDVIMFTDFVRFLHLLSAETRK